jgi:hypothetical protein
MTGRSTEVTPRFREPSKPRPTNAARDKAWSDRARRRDGSRFSSSAAAAIRRASTHTKGVFGQLTATAVLESPQAAWTTLRGMWFSVSNVIRMSPDGDRWLNSGSRQAASVPARAARMRTSAKSTGSSSPSRSARQYSQPDSTSALASRAAMSIVSHVWSPTWM